MPREIIPAYPASPLGFSEAGRLFNQEKFLPMLLNTGYQPLDPWTLTDPAVIKSAMQTPFGQKQRQRWRDANKIIGANNAHAIKRSRLVVAVLDGTDVDSGTASEIGFAAALGIPVIGYRGDFRLSADNIGSTVNLQVEHFIGMHGGEIVTTLKDLEDLLVEWHRKLESK